MNYPFPLFVVVNHDAVLLILSPPVHAMRLQVLAYLVVNSCVQLCMYVEHAVILIFPFIAINHSVCMHTKGH